jgi:hexosaminidase
VLWSYRENRDFYEFSRRLENHYPRLESWGVNYGFEKIPIGFETEIVEGGIKVSVKKAEPELIASVDYGTGLSTDWTADSTFSTSQNLNFRANLNGRDYPKDFNLNLAVHQGLGIEPSTSAEFSSYYTAGGKDGLTDGIQATLDFRDGRWQGYQLADKLEVTIDLGELKPVSSCSANFYQYNNAWIFAPTLVEYSISEDGESFTSIGISEPESEPKTKGQFIEILSMENAEPIQARFVRMTISSLGPCPDWHDAAGSSSWIFVDEFVIN